MMLRQIEPDSFTNAGLFVLRNGHGLAAELCAFGASILRIHTPDRAGVFENIALSFKNIASLTASGSYAGATIGPVAGRLRDGILHIAGTDYPLTRNDGAHTLHGGIHGLSQTVWKVDAYEKDRVAFRCRLPDGLDGFPGNRCICVQYTLDENNCLSIGYTAETDHATFFNLTNHVYWNLSGNFTATAYGQQLELASDTVIYNDAAHLPVQPHSVGGTPFDFTAARTLQSAIDTCVAYPQLINAHGYNNAYLLRPDAGFAARLTDPTSGRRVTLRTDYPALVLYSGGYLPVPGCAIALEAQYPPDSREPVLHPGQTYRHSISFAFDTLT